MNLNNFREYIRRTAVEVVGIATSRELLRQHLRTPLYQNAYYLMGSTAVTAIFGMVFWVVTARLYPVTAVGLASAIIAALGLLSIFSNLGLGIGLIRFLPSAGEKSNSMVNTCFTLSGLASIVIALIFLAGLSVWSPALLPVTRHPAFFAAFVLLAPVWTLNTLVGAPFVAKRSAKFSFATNAIMSVLRVVLLIIFATIFGSAFGIFASTGIAMSAALLITAFWFLPKVLPGYFPVPAIRKEAMGELSRYSGGNYLARTLLEMPPLVLPLMVINILGAEMNAYFYIAWSVTQMLLVIPSAVFNSLFAEASNEEESLRANIAKSLKLVLLLQLPAILVVLIIASHLLQIFGAAYSENGALLLRIMALSAIPWAINYLYITIGRVRKDVISVIRVSAVMTCLTLGLSLFLMLSTGNLTGVAIGYLAGQSIVAVATGLSLFRHYYQIGVSSN